MKKRYTAPDAELFYPSPKDIITLSDVDNVYFYDDDVYDGGHVSWGDGNGLF